MRRFFFIWCWDYRFTVLSLMIMIVVEKNRCKGSVLNNPCQLSIVTIKSLSFTIAGVIIKKSSQQLPENYPKNFWLIAFATASVIELT
jgi:hypothetical protein